MKKKKSRKFIWLLIILLIAGLGLAVFLLFGRERGKSAGEETKTVEVQVGIGEEAEYVQLVTVRGNEITYVQSNQETVAGAVSMFGRGETEAAGTEGETKTELIPVGTSVTTKLGTVTTFSRLRAGDEVALVRDKSSGEITALYIVE